MEWVGYMLGIILLLTLYLIVDNFYIAKYRYTKYKYFAAIKLGTVDDNYCVLVQDPVDSNIPGSVDVYSKTDNGLEKFLFSIEHSDLVPITRRKDLFKMARSLCNENSYFKYSAHLSDEDFKKLLG